MKKAALKPSKAKAPEKKPVKKSTKVENKDVYVNDLPLADRNFVNAEYERISDAISKLNLFCKEKGLAFIHGLALAISLEDGFKSHAGCSHINAREVDLVCGKWAENLTDGNSRLVIDNLLEKLMEKC